MYPIYSMDIALSVMKSRWEDASGKVPECVLYIPCNPPGFATDVKCALL